MMGLIKGANMLERVRIARRWQIGNPEPSRIVHVKARETPLLTTRLMLLAAQKWCRLLQKRALSLTTAQTAMPMRATMWHIGWEGSIRCLERQLPAEVVDSRHFAEVYLH